MSDVYIVSAARTPVGAFQGALKTQTAVDLGVTAAQAAIERSGLQPGQVDEAYIGCVLQGGVGQAPARQVVLRAGCGDATEATTVNKVCASGLKAVALGAQSIQLGHAQVVLAGGMESMSNAPFYLPRGAPAYGNITALDAVQNDGLTDAQDKFLMGVSADATAAKHGISRDDQDTYAVSSYERANAAWDSLAFEDEIVPVILKDKKGNVTNVAQDEGFRHYNADKMRTLRPAFGKDGTVTAANASSLNDGASALLLAGAQTVQDAGLKPLAKIVGTSSLLTQPPPMRRARRSTSRPRLRSRSPRRSSARASRSRTSPCSRSTRRLPSSRSPTPRSSASTRPRSTRAAAASRSATRSAAQARASLSRSCTRSKRASTASRASATYVSPLLPQGGGGASAIVVQRV